MRQPSLFAVGPPAVAPLDGLVRSQLDDSSWMDQCRGWLGGADDLYDELAASLRWRHTRRWMYDRIVEDPRLSCGLDPFGASAPSIVAEIAGRLSEHYGVSFGAGFCNWYRSGHDSVAWHSDRIGRWHAHPLVVIVSLGGPRRFLLRPRGGGIAHRLTLHSGDLLVMGGACQHRWEHSVPKAAWAAPRISVTLRHDTSDVPEWDRPNRRLIDQSLSGRARTKIPEADAVR